MMSKEKEKAIDRQRILLGEEFSLVCDESVEMFNDYVDTFNPNRVQLCALLELIERKQAYQKVLDEISLSGFTIDECLNAFCEYQKADEILTEMGLA